ncbi:MAG: hypothetical protein AAGJ38_03985 [Planctomycetota bacterium]
MFASALSVVRLRQALSLCAAISVATPTVATVLDFRVTQTPGTSFTGEPLVLNDLLLSFEGDYIGSQLIVELDAGSIYQHPYGVAPFNPPAASAIESVSSITSDTYFAHGPDGQTGYRNPFIVGGPVNIDHDQVSILQTPTQLAIAWSRPPGQDINNQNDFRVFRLALTPEASGSFTFFTITQDGFYGDEYLTSAPDRPHFVVEAGHVVASDDHPNPVATPEPKPEPEPELSLGSPRDALPINPIKQDANAWWWNHSSATETTPLSARYPWLFNSWNVDSAALGRKYGLIDTIANPRWYAAESLALNRGRAYDNIAIPRIDMPREIGSGWASASDDPVSRHRNLTWAFEDGHLDTFGFSASDVVATPEPALLGGLIPGLLLLRRRSHGSP